MSTLNNALPEEIHAIFCGDINLFNANRLVNNLTAAVNSGVKRVHLLFHSWGGLVGDGIFIHNLLQTFPIEVIVYNGGQVASAGVLAFMGAKNRKTTKNAIFMIHRSHISPQMATVEKLKIMTEGLVLDDIRSDQIFRNKLNLPQEIWDQLKYHDVNLCGEDAIKFGFADGIADFAPPLGGKVFNALA